MTAQSLPGQVLEQMLARAPFEERVRAMSVCSSWRQHLKQPGLPLWQAVSIPDNRIWKEAIEEKLTSFLMLQRWLRRYGGGLLQLQCCTSFCRWDQEEDGLLAAFLSTLADAAPSLQALRRGGGAGTYLRNSGMLSIASMGVSLRQLALVGLQQVTHTHLAAALSHLPMLQDLAVMYVDERDGIAMSDQGFPQAHEYTATEMMALLFDIAASRPGLRTLALGHLPPTEEPPMDLALMKIELDGQPLPTTMSRLTALSSLALHHIGWEYAPEGLPHLPQLRRLSLVGDHGKESECEPGFQHQLSTLAGLQALQVTLPDWPGRLPLSLTQLVISPLEDWEEDVAAARFARRLESCGVFLRVHVPPLHSLQHLALHGLDEIGQQHLATVCTAAAALPHLISLHLVNCYISVLPMELCGLTRLQLLNLSENCKLFDDSTVSRAFTPLEKLSSCRVLDLRVEERTYQNGVALHFRRTQPLLKGAVSAIVGMPALERLALPRTEEHDRDPAFAEERAALAQRRAPGLPPIRFVTEVPESERWSTVDVELPFEEVNDMLGVQLDRRIVRGVPLPW